MDRIYRIALLGLALASSAGIGGCQAGPQLSAKLHWPHKDVAIVSITTDRRLSPDGYLAIAQRELQALYGRDLEEAKVPIYEVRFEYFLSRGPAVAERVARVVFSTRNGQAARDLANPPEITIY